MPEVERSDGPVAIEVAGDTHIGGRPHNEDAVLLRPDLNLFIVADGAGGKNAGNVAASLAVTTVAHFFEETEMRASRLPLHDGLGLFTAARRLATAVQEANKEVLAVAKTSDRHKGMGTTVVAILIDAARRWLHLAWVGDSRCYRLREGRLELLTFDHSLINDVLELRPNIADDRVKKLPQNVITRALGMSDSLRVSVRSHEIAVDDRYLICSDGLSDVIDDERLTEVMRGEQTCDAKVERLLMMAAEAGAEDNVAVAVLDCAASESGEGSSRTRPLRKKSSQPQMAAASPADLPPPRGVADSVPEIVLYDPTHEDRESTPLIHVVPAQPTPEVVDAFEGVVPPEPPESSPILLANERGTEPGPIPTPKSKTLPRMASVSDEEEPVDARPPPFEDEPPTERVPEHDLAQLVASAEDEPPAGSDPAPDPVDDEPTVAADSLDDGEAATRVYTGRAVLAAAERELADHGATERGGAAAVSQRAGQSSVRRGAADRSKGSGTLQGAGPSGGTLPKPPGPSRTVRSTLHGALPPPPAAKKAAVARITGKGASGEGAGQGASEADQKLPVPPMRQPLATSDFVLEDNAPCHACGSVIARNAEICMYCGVATQFESEDG